MSGPRQRWQAGAGPRGLRVGQLAQWQEVGMEVVAVLGSSLSLDLAGDLVELGSLTEGDHMDATGRSPQCPQSEHP